MNTHWLVASIGESLSGENGSVIMVVVMMVMQWVLMMMLVRTVMVTVLVRFLFVVAVGFFVCFCFFVIYLFTAKLDTS